MSASNDEYWAPGEAARMLHISPRTVLRWQREGRISGVIPGSRDRRVPQQRVVPVIVPPKESGADGD